MPRRPGRPWVGLLAIVVVAITLRCWAMVHFHALQLPVGESGAIAENLVEGNGFSFTEFSRLGPTSVRGPVYPMLLAGLDAILGITRHHAQIAALAINVIAAGVSVVMAFYFVRSLLGPRAGWIAAILFAVWPTQIYSAVLLQGLCLGVLFTLITLRFAGSPRANHAVFAGAFAGLTILTEPVLFLPLFFVTLLIGRRRSGHALLMIAAALALVGPWMLRNRTVHHQFVGITNTFWPDAYRGNGPDATGSEHLQLTDHQGKILSQIDRLTPQRIDALKAQSEIGRVALFRTWTTDWIRANPMAYARLSLERAVKTLWLDWDHRLARNWIDLLSRTIALGGLITAVGLELPRGTKLMLGLFAIGLATATMFSMAEARMAVLMDIPQLIGVAAFLTSWLNEGMGRGSLEILSA